MTTPERPSLADSLARIDAVLAASDDRVGLFVQSMLGGGPTTAGPPYTHVHTLPSAEDELAAAVGPSFTVTKPGHLPGAPGPTCPGCAADAARPGWLARTLRRLFT